jgi:hypothetical protein
MRPFRMMASRSVPSAVPPMRFESAIASRFDAGTNAWIRLSHGSRSNATPATFRSSAAGRPHSRRATRICAVATVGELGSSITIPSRLESFHSPKVRARANRTEYSSTNRVRSGGKKSSNERRFDVAHAHAFGHAHSGKGSLISIISKSPSTS